VVQHGLALEPLKEMAATCCRQEAASAQSGGHSGLRVGGFPRNRRVITPDISNR
jgi:hypothetical protein